MFAALGNLLRRARVRNVAEGKVQTARVEAMENDAKDAAERWQDYGFAGNPVDGQGLVLNVGGHTLVIRLDRIAERPQLAAYEVALWHREGHLIKLKANGAVEITGGSLTIAMSGAVAITSASLTHNGKNVGSTHTHGGVTSGGSSTSVPN